VKACLLLGKDDTQRAAEVFKKVGYGAASIMGEGSRCQVCNGLLEA